MEKLTLKKDFYPEEIQCVDNALKNYNRHGIANYWDARVYSNFSKIGLKIDAVGASLIPFNPIGNTKQFKNSYSYILTDVSPSKEINQFWKPSDKLIKLYGPLASVICGTKKVILFRENQLKICYFKKTGDEFTWMADTLPSRFPSTSIREDGSRIARSSDNSDFLTYGPYINLPKGSYRFLINYISDSPLNLPAATWDVSGVKSGPISQGTIPIIILGYLTFLNTLTIFKKFSTLKKNYYSKELECIDNAIKDEGTRGISDYWTARPISLFSRKKLIVQAFNENLTPFLMLTDISKFTNDYTFAIIHKEFPVEQIVKLYNGNPNKIMNCGEKKIFIYNQDALKVPCFRKKGYQFTWPATALPSRLSMSPVSAKKKRIAKEIDGENFLSFGPYIVLPEGHYHFSVRYSSSNSTSTQVGVSDVFTIINGILLQRPIFGTNKKVRNINGDFFVNHSMAYRDPFEIRVYFLGKGDLELEALTLERA
ncbi:hypothetical protein FQR65_LT05192 [Abscondita terminalis]|nr:hypothetical protein FQR65_LT05192 [Abscondita terminalis]